MTYFSAAITQCARPLSRPARPLRRLLSWCALWRSRRTLGMLPSHLLDDIGVSAKVAEKEANRPVWDVPAHWRD